VTRVLRTEAELREFVREPHRAVVEKDTDHIDPESRRFIEASPLFFLASTAADGTCDLSPRGDPAGSVLVLDEHTLAFADRKGNRRLDTFRNLLEHPKVGMLFVAPGMAETVRVNGTARIVVDAPYLDRLAMRGVTPTLAVEVHVEELFLHCGRAFSRAGLWDQSTWPRRGDLPTPGQLTRSQTSADISAREVDEALERANKDLY
jgi:PPOX class probable FMN-dependent enzyme